MERLSYPEVVVSCEHDNKTSDSVKCQNAFNPCFLERTQLWWIEVENTQAVLAGLHQLQLCVWMNILHQSIKHVIGGTLMASLLQQLLDCFKYHSPILSNSLLEP